MTKTYKRDIERAARIKKTAEIVGVSERQVRRVLGCEQVNDEVLDVYLDLVDLDRAAFEAAKENRLLAAVEKLLPTKPVSK